MAENKTISTIEQYHEAALEYVKLFGKSDITKIWPADKKGRKASDNWLEWEEYFIAKNMKHLGFKQVRNGEIGSVTVPCKHPAQLDPAWRNSVIQL